MAPLGAIAIPALQDPVLNVPMAAELATSIGSWHKQRVHRAHGEQRDLPALVTIRLTGEKNVAGHYGQVPRAGA